MVVGDAKFDSCLFYSHSLGAILNLIDSRATVKSDDGYDWTVCCSARVVGCKAPSNATLHEFRDLNKDEMDARYNSSLGMYEPRTGLENILLTWTGPEYMYHMLKRNHVDIPEEGFTILRLFPLRDWHSKGGYLALANEDDEDVKPFVADFDELRREVRNSLLLHSIGRLMIGADTRGVI